jgi:hypothetical protein
LIALLIIAGLPGCASQYVSKKMFGGYSDTALAPDVYRISFQGNRYTSTERAQDFAILRAADLTLSHGFRYFAIINQTEGGRSGAYTYVNAQRYGNMVFGDATTIPLFLPNAGLMIRCFKDRPTDVFVLDADFVSRSLRQKYQIAQS